MTSQRRRPTQSGMGPRGGRDPRDLGGRLAISNSPHAGDSVRELGLFRDCRTPAGLREVLRREVDTEVEAMLTLVADADAFDVVELMRMREFPPVPGPHLQWDGTALGVEIVAAMLLGRGARKPDPTPRAETRPHQAISELHDRAQRLSRLATYRHMFDGGLSDDPLAPLAASYRAAVLNIRNLQYDTIRESHEGDLFDNDVVAPLMMAQLGYVYPDVLLVRDSMFKIGGVRMTKLRNDTAAIVMEHPNPADVPQEAAEAFRAAMIPFMFLPAERAIITAADVAADCGINTNAAAAVMSSYAQSFDSSTGSADRVYNMLTSTNPFLATPLLTDDTGNFVETANGIGFDSLRRIVEDALKQTRSWHTYDKKVRQVVTERLAMASLEKALRTPPKLTGFKYFMPADDVSHQDLSSSCTALNLVGKVTEGDGLFVIGDVAICVEVKGKSMSPSTRTGDVRRLWNDLKATIGDGCDQAARLQALIETNDGIWLADRTWLDLSGVREVRSVVTLLDDVGPLGTNLGDHHQTGLLPADRTPWVTSLHDLETIAQVCDRPSEFLLYLRRRADSEVATYYKAVDELDLFMRFMNANLFVEPEPDQMRTEHPILPRVSGRDRRARARDAVMTTVGDECQHLNAWMSRHELDPDDPQPPKPTYQAVPEILRLIDTIEAHGADLIRFGADVLAMAGEVQKDLLNIIRECVRRTRDGRSHDGMISLAGAWGHPTVFVFTRPQGVELEEVRRNFEGYMRLKRHQLNSDRSYGLLFNHAGDLDLVMYFNSPSEPDSSIDALVAHANLQPVFDTSPSIPPSAKRSTQRLRGKKSRGKKR